MFDIALSEVALKHRLPVDAKTAKRLGSKTIDVALYSISIVTDSSEAHIEWTLDTPAIEAHAQKLGEPDIVSKVFSGGKALGRPAKWRFCAVVDEVAFDSESAKSYTNILGRAKVVANSSGNISLPLKPSQPDTATFFVMFDSELRFAIEDDVAVMIQNMPAPDFQDIAELQMTLDTLFQSGKGNDSGAQDDSSALADHMKAGYQNMEDIRKKLIELGYKGTRLSHAMERIEFYYHCLFLNKTKKNTE